MSMSIKSPEAERLTRELAGATGESLTEAVTVAVRERLERLRRGNRAGGLADRLLSIGADLAPRLREPYRSGDHGDLLYDDMGLPR
jgi:antitoxin VapB